MHGLDHTTLQEQAHGPEGVGEPFLGVMRVPFVVQVVHMRISVFQFQLDLTVSPFSLPVKLSVSSSTRLDRQVNITWMLCCCASAFLCMPSVRCSQPCMLADEAPEWL